MANTVTVSGMFGVGKTYFADSPVVIDISGLQWSGSSPFTVVHVEVIYNNNVVGDFRSDTGGQTTASFDISSALRAIWSGYNYDAEGAEVKKAQAAITGNASQTATRAMRFYILHIYTEYLTSDGVFITTQCSVLIDGTEYTDIPGGQCLMGGWTEWERSLIADKANADVSALEHTGVRYGDGSTKPISSPEHVGVNSITSWVDVGEEVVSGVKRGYTKSIFYPAPSGISLPAATGSADDVPDSQQGWTGHAPIVLRDNQPYVDFLFVNRRGVVETCSGLMKEALGINVNVQQYSRSNGPSFHPTRSLMAVGSDGRRSWDMSSGYVTREWAEWWTMEFLGGKRKQWWMRYPLGDASGTFVPVTVKPAKNDISIYDRSKQEMAHVDFTVSLALEG